MWVSAGYVGSRIIARLSEDQTVNTELWQLVGVLGLVMFMDEVFWRSAELIAWRVKPVMIERLRYELFQEVLGRSHSYFVNASSGRVAHWINSIVSTFDFFADITMWTVWGRMLSMIYATGFLFTVHWSLALVFASWLFLLFAFNMWRGRKFSRLVEKHSDEQSVAASMVVDTIANNLPVRTFNTRAYETARMASQRDTIVRLWRRSWIHNTLTNFVKGSSSSFATVIAFVIALGLLQNGQIGIGGVVLFMTYFTNAASSLWQLAWALDKYFSLYGTMNNALKGLHGDDEHSVLSHDNVRSTLQKVQLRLKDVSFHYQERPDEAVIDGLSLTIEAGKKVGIVGHSGAGKTTLLGLLLGLYQPSSGTIHVNETTLEPKTINHLRDNMAFVPQDTSCLLYTSPSPRDRTRSRMPSSA